MGVFLAIVSLIDNPCHGHRPGEHDKEVKIGLLEAQSWGAERLWASPAFVHKKQMGEQGKH